MKIDITLEMTMEAAKEAGKINSHLRPGHHGTHFDVMDKDFPLEYVERKGIFFDVSGVGDRDIEESDIDMDSVEEGMFVGFYTGFVEEKGYGTEEYFGWHPQLSMELIKTLVEKKISFIGIDFSGARNRAEHEIMDQYCADRGVFILENLCNLKAVLDKASSCTVYTFPISFSDLTGLPCRVVAEV